MHNMKIICMIRMNKQRCHALIKSVQEAFKKKKKKKSFHLFTLLRTQGASSHSFNKSFSLFFFFIPTQIHDINF